MYFYDVLSALNHNCWSTFITIKLSEYISYNCACHSPFIDGWWKVSFNIKNSANGTGKTQHCLADFESQDCLWPALTVWPHLYSFSPFPLCSSHVGALPCFLYMVDSVLQEGHCSWCSFCLELADLFKVCSSLLITLQLKGYVLTNTLLANHPERDGHTLWEMCQGKGTVN